MTDTTLIELDRPRNAAAPQVCLGELLACLQEAAEQELGSARAGDAVVAYALADGFGRVFSD